MVLDHCIITSSIYDGLDMHQGTPQVLGIFKPEYVVAHEYDDESS